MDRTPSADDPTPALAEQLRAGPSIMEIAMRESDVTHEMIKAGSDELRRHGDASEVDGADLEEIARRTFSTMLRARPKAPPEPPIVTPTDRRGVEADGWRSIESAPDDTPILVAIPKFNDESRGYVVAVGSRVQGIWLDPNLDETYEPTHWRPLPAPPASGGE